MYTYKKAEKFYLADEFATFDVYGRKVDVTKIDFGSPIEVDYKIIDGVKYAYTVRQLYWE